MKTLALKLGITAISALSVAGCIINPTPNAGSFSMTEAQTKAAQYNALQTQNTDREAHRGKLRDEIEVRAWERNISAPNTTIVVPSRY
ncbi:MAG: hypothetical protein PHR16_06560 [Methylovulum sp.]|nr:hypothetical protein [Methylovulum sp.]